MRIGVISGSHRDAETNRISEYIVSKLKEMEIDVYFYSLKGNPLPLWSEEAWDDESKLSKEIITPISNELYECDAFVIATPEWCGMAAPALKNFFLYFSNGEFSFKPAYLVSVSAGRGGAYPVAELRSSSYKNNQIMYIPEHLIVRDCENVFNGKSDDSYLEGRLEYGLNLLSEMTALLMPLQTENVIDLENYPYGM
jgi:NAD(P)H-dependent FMN reductase